MRRGAACAVMWCWACGCQAPGPVFPPIEPAIVWPAPPDRARVRFVGVLTGEASLGVRAATPLLRALVEGPPAPREFSTPTAVAVAGERVVVADPRQRAVMNLDLTARTFEMIVEAEGERYAWPLDVTWLGAGPADGGGPRASGSAASTAEACLAVCDSQRAAVFVHAADGRFVRSIGRGQLERPVALDWWAARGELWVVDSAAHGVAVFDAEGVLLRRVGGRGGGPGEFNYPTGVACRERFGVLVADSMNFRVQWLEAGGGLRRVVGQKGDAAGDLALPRDVAFDSEGHAYVLDSQFENVQIFDGEGRLLLAFGEEGRGPGQFYLPSGITIDEQDRIWIADTYNRRVQVFQYLREQE